MTDIAEAPSRALRIRCQSRQSWIRVCAEVLFFCADLDLESPVGQELMNTVGLALAEPTAQDFINHPGVEFLFDDDTP